MKALIKSPTGASAFVDLGPAAQTTVLRRARASLAAAAGALLSGLDELPEHLEPGDLTDAVRDRVVELGTLAEEAEAALRIIDVVGELIADG